MEKCYSEHYRQVSFKFLVKLFLFEFTKTKEKRLYLIRNQYFELYGGGGYQAPQAPLVSVAVYSYSLTFIVILLTLTGEKLL